MSGLRAVLFLGAIAVLSGLAAASAAHAATFSVPYDFTVPGAGNAGWTQDQAAPWFTHSYAPGTGLALKATGNGGLDYPSSIDARWVWDAPAGTTITSVDVDGLNGAYADGLRSRMELDPATMSPVPMDYVGLNESWGHELTGPGDTWTGQAYQLTPPARTSARRLYLWYFPRSCGPFPLPPCGPVNPGLATPLTLKKAIVTLDDPTPPAVTLDAPTLPPNGGWTNATSTAVSATGSDAQSGTAKVVLTAKGPGGGTWPLATDQADTNNSTPRPAGTPQLAADAAGVHNLALPKQGQLTLTVTATNGAGTASATAPRVINLDRTPPKITWPNKLQASQNITLADSTSSLTVAQLTTAGKVSPVASCPAGKKSCTLHLQAGEITATTTDQAGNTTTEKHTITALPGKGSSTSGQNNTNAPGNHTTTKPCKTTPCKPGSPSKTGTGKKPGMSRPKASVRVGRLTAVAQAAGGTRRYGDLETRLGKDGKRRIASIRKGKKGGEAGCSEHTTLLSGPNQFSLGTLCLGDRILSTGSIYVDNCQDAGDTKGCRYMVARVQPQGATQSMCAVIPIQAFNADSAPGEDSPIKTAIKKAKKIVPVNKSGSDCDQELLKQCKAEFSPGRMGKYYDKAYAAIARSKCRKPPHLPISATAAMVGPQPGADSYLAHRQGMAAYKAATPGGSGDVPWCRGVIPPLLSNPAPPPPGGTNSICSDTFLARNLHGWRHIVRDGQYAMLKGTKPLAGVSEWSYVPTAVLTGPSVYDAHAAITPDTARARQFALDVCNALYPGTANPTSTQKYPKKKKRAWGNVDTCTPLPDPPAPPPKKKH